MLGPISQFIIYYVAYSTLIGLDLGLQYKKKFCDILVDSQNAIDSASQAEGD